jgi:hypothetical protein
MSLENLLKIKQLQRHKATATEVQRLLGAAARNLADSGVSGLSDENRFDMAYKAIMQCALIGLMANGYRPSTSMPGHHQTMIQTLEQTLGVTQNDWVVMDSLRRKRNLNDYSGDLVEAAAVRTCVALANQLFVQTRKWLQAHRPELLLPV